MYICYTNVLKRIQDDKKNIYLKCIREEGVVDIKRLIINGDDFGYSHAVNLGIAESHVRGVLTSTTLMANMAGTDHAVKLSKEMPNLDIGIHLTLTCGKPILEKSVNSLVKEDGYFYGLGDFEKGMVNIDEDELYSEWKAQIDRLYSLGVKLSHMDSHHHIHTFEKPAKIAKVLSGEYNLPIRNCNRAKNNSEINFLDLFNYGVIRDMDTKYRTVREQCFEIIESKILENIEFEKSEVMCHPAFLDSPLLEGSSFNVARIREVDILRDPYMKELISKYDIKLCNYKTI